MVGLGFALCCRRDRGNLVREHLSEHAEETFTGNFLGAKMIDLESKYLTGFFKFVLGGSAEWPKFEIS